jgi:phosphohistidine phosphatase
LKSITLLRHAKAVPFEDGIDDHARPLNARGRAAASAIGQERSLLLPELVLCSGARRTRETWDLIRQSWTTPPPAEITDALYLVEAPALMAMLMDLPPKFRSVWIIGHNPGLHDLARQFARRAPATPAGAALEQHFPTAARATFAVDADRWAALAEAPCRLTAYVIPDRQNTK